MKEKDINKSNLSPSYSRIPYKEFEKTMKGLGFVGNYDLAFEKLGGKIPTKKKVKKEGAE
jgi:hypothetical protein